MNGTHYTIDGVDYPRVTTILGVLRKEGLERWRGKVGNAEANRVSEAARDWGTRVHAACEQVAAGALLECPPDIEPTVSAYCAWLKSEVKRVIAVERLVVSRRWHFAGTADLVVELMDGSLAVADLKTSNSAGAEYRLQLAAYQAALAEDDIHCSRRMVVQLPSREPGVLRIHEYTDPLNDWTAYLEALRLWRWHDEHKDDWKHVGALFIRRMDSADDDLPF